MIAVVLLLKVTLILAVALAAAWLTRHSRAAVRHVLLMAAFAVVMILPLASMLGPTVRISVPSAVQSAMAPLENEPGVDVLSADSSASATTNPSPADLRSSVPSTSSLLALAWLAGTVVCLATVFVGLFRVRVLRRSASPWPRGRQLVAALASGAGIRRSVDVLLHDSIAGPMTCGMFQPVIVLPADAVNWPLEDLHRAVVHELEHVRRGDWMSQVSARIVTAVYWFHPIVWVAWRQLSLEAERACDDAVLVSTEPTAYADQLVLLAQRLSTASNRPQLAMANRSDLATRITAVLDSRQQRGRAGARSVVLACGASAILLAAVSPIRLVAGSQDPQATAPAKTRLTYDAASIKRCEAEETPTGARGTAAGTNATFSPGRFYVPCVTTEQLIYLAYASSGAPVSDRLINDDPGSASNAMKVRGGPDWVHSLREKYSIEATAAGATERTVLMGLMLRSLLEDRFKLKLHRETEEAPMYALTVGKGGLKLKPMKEDDCDPDAEPAAVPTDAKPRCGMLNMVGVEGKIRWTFGGFELSGLAARLSSQLKMHVIDRTNTKDRFVYRFEFARDPDPLVTEANIFAAVEDQLGLKLEKTRGPRGFLVIDHIERPTPDGPAHARSLGSGRVSRKP
jgi:uncharacterized protein (TIGR03435 family)